MKLTILNKGPEIAKVLSGAPDTDRPSSAATLAQGESVEIEISATSLAFIAGEELARELVGEFGNTPAPIDEDFSKQGR